VHHPPAPRDLLTRRDDGALLALWTLFWLMMALVSFEDHRHNADVRWWEPLLWEGSSCLVASAWLLVARRAARRWQALLGQPWPWFGRHLVWMPAVILSFVAAVYGLRHAVYALLGLRYAHEGWAYLIFYESLKLLLFGGLWLGIFFGLSSFRSWQAERLRLLELQRSLAETQLARLRSQLRPHFLFNALNTISSLMQVDVARADRLLTQLADLLRASLQAGAQETSTLGEEVGLLRLYAGIMQERFGARASIAWALPDELMCATVPHLVLQPLLENAYRHGVERSTTPVHIVVSAQREAGRLVLRVANDGRLGGALGAGIGLHNTRERLRLLHGDAAEVSLSAEGGRVVARLALPWQPQGA